MRNMFLSFLAVGVLILVVGNLAKNKDFKITGLTSNPTPTPLSLKTIKVGNKTINGNLANTAETRSKGLGGVTSMPADQGMLFVFESKKITPSFWMKGMKISLDIIWVSDGKVSQINTNIMPPATNTPDSRLTIYTPTYPIDYVLEVNGGFSTENNIKAGDLVDLSKI